MVIALEVLDEIAGPGKATVIGTGKQMDAVSASLANALMIRCMDYNDIYWKQDPSHPSDIFPGRDGLLRARGWRRPRVDCRSRAGP